MILSVQNIKKCSIYIYTAAAAAEIVYYLRKATAAAAAEIVYYLRKATAAAAENWLSLDGGG